MNPLSKQQLHLNQTFIDLMNEYQFLEEDEGNPVNFDAKGVFKHIWNEGYMLRLKDHTIYE